MTSVSERYRALIDEQRLAYDPAQAGLIARLDALSATLEGYRAEAKPRALSPSWPLPCSTPMTRESFIAI